MKTMNKSEMIRELLSEYQHQRMRNEQALSARIAEAGKIDFVSICTPNFVHYSVAKTFWEQVCEFLRKTIVIIPEMWYTVLANKTE